MLLTKADKRSWFQFGMFTSKRYHFQSILIQQQTNDMNTMFCDYHIFLLMYFNISDWYEWKVFISNLGSMLFSPYVLSRPNQTEIKALHFFIWHVFPVDLSENQHIRELHKLTRIWFTVTLTSSFFIWIQVRLQLKSVWYLFSIGENLRTNLTCMLQKFCNNTVSKGMFKKHDNYDGRKHAISISPASFFRCCQRYWCVKSFNRLYTVN